MSIEMIRSALLSCLVINLGLLLWWFVMFAVARDWIYRIHGKWFKLSTEQFDVIHYSGMAFFKICIFMFNVAPYVALLIIG